MAAKPLNKQERKFKERYLETANVVESALYAGYAPSTAKSHAFRWIRNDKCPANKQHLCKAIMDAQQKRSARTERNADLALIWLADYIEADPVELFEPGTFTFRPIDQWPLPFRRMLNGIDVQRISRAMSEGDDEEVRETIKVKFPDKLKAIELYGRHVNIGAWSNDAPAESIDDRAKRMQQARQRSTDLVKQEDGSYAPAG